MRLGGEDNMQEILTYAEAGRYLNLPVGTIYSLVARQLVPHVRLGPRTVRFNRAELDAWIDARRVPAKAGEAA